MKGITLIEIPAPDINVTPLIDVLLVLLIIFMTITPLKLSRFKALIPSEPKSETMPTEAHPLTLVVTIDKNLQLKLNRLEEMGSVDNTGKLSRELTKIFAERAANHVGQRTIFVKAPKSIRYGEVVKVVDALKGTGAHPIGLQIDELTDL